MIRNVGIRMVLLVLASCRQWWHVRTAERAAAAALVGAVLVATGLLLVHPAAAGVAADATQAPFDHQRHERISCGACHGAGERHRTLLIRTERDCLACHHEAVRAASCDRCHGSANLPEPGTVQRALTLSVWEEARPRALRFGHAIHSGVQCLDCHRTPVTLAMDRACGSCHTEHHSAAASCIDCHEAPESGVHGASVHLSCAGSGCHAAPAAPSPTLSRELCLACHEAQRTHKPEGRCASCHQIPEPRTALRASQHDQPSRAGFDP